LVILLTSWIVVEGGDSSGNSGQGETPQIAKRVRRLTARPVESVRLKRKSTILMNLLFVQSTWNTGFMELKLYTFLSFMKNTLQTGVMPIC